MKKPKSYSIQSFIDNRGRIEFSNEFNFSPYKRFYLISPDHEGQVRAWQGHKFEEKAFLIISGKIKIVLIPALDLDRRIFGTAKEFILDESEPGIIYIPGGYLNGFQFLSPDSKLMVFSNFTLEESKGDDYRFDPLQFYDWTK